MDCNWLFFDQAGPGVGVYKAAHSQALSKPSPSLSQALSKPILRPLPGDIGY